MESFTNAPLALQIFVTLHAGIAAFQALAVVFQYRLAVQIGKQEHFLWGAAWAFMGLCHLGYALVALTADIPGTFVHSGALLPWIAVFSGHLALMSLGGAFLELRGVQVGPLKLLLLAVVAFVLSVAPGLGKSSTFEGQIACYAWQLGTASLGCLISGPILFVRRKAHGRSLRVLGGAVTLYAWPLGLGAWITVTRTVTRQPEVMNTIALLGCLDFTLVGMLGFSLVQTVLDRSRGLLEERLMLEKVFHTGRTEDAKRRVDLIQQVPANLFVVSKSGHCLNELQPYRIPFGLDGDTLVRVPLLDLIRDRIHPDDFEEARRVFSWHEMGTDQVRSALLRVRGDEGADAVIAVRAQQSEALGGILVSTSDVTEQQQTERRVLQARRLESVGRLAARVVHDFNNLLSIYETTTSALRQTSPLTSEQRELLQELEQATERGTALTRPLLGFARSPTRDVRVLDANTVVEAFLPIARRLLQESVELKWQPSLVPLAIRCDSARLEQVLVNLVTNGSDAMPNGGTLTLGVTEGPHSTVIITVQDTGEGMAKETLERAIEPFFTTKPVGRGTGLGLSTCREIMEVDGGSITLDSQLGHGTCVVVSYPQAELSLVPPSGDELESGERLKRIEPSGRILLVEDDAALRRNLRRVLLLAGYEVDDEPDGEEGLRRFSEGEDYFCVVSDVVMPKLSGDAMAHAIWKRRPETPIIFISGYTELESFEFTSFGNAQFLSKPFAPELLLACIARLRVVSEPPELGRVRGIVA
jgi:signal transduction histidine kinase/CheY-like chemotaxis protein